MYKSSNPALNQNVFINSAREGLSAETMTIQGTVNKTAFLLVLVFLSAMYSWSKTAVLIEAGGAFPMLYFWIAMIGAFVFSLITIFNKKIAKYTASIYAVLEGVVLGLISMMFETRYPGIAIQAIMGTFGVFFMMIFLYKSKIIKPTENFKLGVVSATGGIFFMYLISFILSFFGINLGFINGNGIFSIIFSLVVVVIASLNLVMDFDFIEKGEELKAPKYMEWYSAFGLLVTLVWLYIEILRLLSKIRSRD